MSRQIQPRRPAPLPSSAIEGASRAYEAAAERGTQAQGDRYLDRLIKYVPTESIALFVTLDGIAGSAQLPPEADSLRTWLPWSILAICLVFTPFYLRVVAGVRTGGQIFLSMLAFVVWALAIGGALEESVVRWLAGGARAGGEALDTWHRLYSTGSSLLVAVFTAFLPIFTPKPEGFSPDPSPST